MKIDQLLTGQEAKPEVKRERWSGGVFGHSPGEIKINFLKNVSRVEAASQPLVHPQTHHLFESCLILLEEFGQRDSIPARGLGHQGLVAVLIVGLPVHGNMTRRSS